jgi:ABC-type multidrug transport system permease subunit
MLAGFRAALAKDVRLLVRDGVGLVFLTVAPIVVITVAGLSLANLYGPDAGASPIVLPLVDADGGRVGRAIAERLAAEPAVRAEPVADADAARRRVREKAAAAALVVPAGTTDAIAAGRPARLVVFTDPVRTFELARVRLLVEELRHAVQAGLRDAAAGELDAARARADAARADLDRTLDRLRADVARLAAARAAARAQSAAAKREASARVDAARKRLAARLVPLRTFLADLEARRTTFDAWLAEVRKQAGRFADRVPPPPAPPVVPPEVAALAAVDERTLLARLLPDDGALASLARVDLPPPPRLPAVELPASPDVRLPGALAAEETSVSGAPRTPNPFDQNVPGFAITFLLLGVLLGVSLALLDERDWGTLDRLRATRTPLGAVLGAKLVARAAVGLAQMALLFAVGRLAFDVSLGRAPWALVLPTAGIVAAGTAFGLVVAGATASREAVLPVGSIVILTMAAAGGCWWPIDLEPRWMRRAALAFPTTWAMDAYNDLMIRREPPQAVLRATAALAAFAVLYLAAGLLLFRRRVRRG